MTETILAADVKDGDKVSITLVGIVSTARRSYHEGKSRITLDDGQAVTIDSTATVTRLAKPIPTEVGSVIEINERRYFKYDESYWSAGGSGWPFRNASMQELADQNGFTQLL